MGYYDIEFFYMPGSPPCRSVMMCVKALGLTNVEMRKIDMYQKAEHKQPWFVKMNPQHTVPTINDSGFILWESRAILIYLVEKYGKEDNPLYPKDHEQRATINRMLNFDMGTLYKSFMDYFQPQLFGYGVADPQKANALKQGLDYLDGYLEKTAYAAGDHLTIADFAILASVTQLEGLEYSYKAYSNVNKWVERLKRELPYYHECSDEGLQMFKEWAKTKIKIEEPSEKSGRMSRKSSSTSVA